MSNTPGLSHDKYTKSHRPRQSSLRGMREAGKVVFQGSLVEVCLALVGVASPAQFKYTKSHRPRQSLELSNTR